MLNAYWADDIVQAERAALAGREEGALMRAASAGLAAHVQRRLVALTSRTYGASVTALVGPGGNGGDALFAAAVLQRRGVAVTVVQVCGAAHAAGLAACRAAGVRVVPGPGGDGSAAGEECSRCGAAVDDGWVHAVADADIVMDGMFGLSGRPGLTGPAQAVTEAIPAGTHVVAVDVPSGLVADSAALPEGSWCPASETVTFGCARVCHMASPADAECGPVTVVPLPVAWDELTPAVSRCEDEDVAAWWPVPTVRDHKYSRGVVGVVAGGDAYAGAAVLAVRGATAAGAGMVRYVGSPECAASVRAACPEMVVADGPVHAWVLGPGVDSEDTKQRLAVRQALGSGRPCVVDAGALAVLRAVAEEAEPAGPVVLTPHAGEAAGLLGSDSAQVVADPVWAATELAKRFGAVVLLKGATTLVADPSGLCMSQAEGPAWLATAGTGDVLAGVVGTLLAAGVPPVQSAVMAAWVHGVAGQWASGGGPLAAGDVCEAIRAVLAQLLGGLDGCVRP